MKVKVTREFIDRTDNLKRRKVGTVLDVDEARAAKLKSLNLVEEINEPVKKRSASKKAQE